jgi:cell division ATPase FtsA
VDWKRGSDDQSAGSHILGFNGRQSSRLRSRPRDRAEDVRERSIPRVRFNFPRTEIVDRLPQEFIVDDQDGITIRLA